MNALFEKPITGDRWMHCIIREQPKKLFTTSSQRTCIGRSIEAWIMSSLAGCRFPTRTRESSPSCRRRNADTIWCSLHWSKHAHTLIALSSHWDCVAFSLMNVLKILLLLLLRWWWFLHYSTRRPPVDECEMCFGLQRLYSVVYVCVSACACVCNICTHSMAVARNLIT